MASERKISSMLVFGVVACMFSVTSAATAERVVWDENGVSETYPPENPYKYTDPERNSEVTISWVKPKKTDVPYVLGGTFSSTNAKTDDGAGFGFVWAVDDEYETRVMNLSAYSGVCLNYSATNPVRLDFVQATIDDYNYFGTLLPTTNGQKINKFVAFADLELGWAKTTSTNKWNVKQQNGLQFSYKGEHVKKYGVSNEVYIYAVRLADECPQHAPEVNASFETEYELNEGEKLVLKMSDIFSDADGDDLSISATFSGNKDVVSSYDDTQHTTLKDAIEFTVNPNPKTDKYTMVITATDPSGRKASVSIAITPIDIPHAPTIRDTTYVVTQGETVSCTGKSCTLYDFATDLDGDEIDLVLYEEPETGSFTFDKEMGHFTYKAPGDFYGEVYFSLYAVETKNPKSVSDTVKFKIKVLDINDPPVVEILDSMITYTIGDGDEFVVTLDDPKSFISVDEDFTDSIWVLISDENAVFSDVDSDIEMRVKTNGLVKTEIKKVGKVSYIVVTAKKDANGLAKVTYYADDGEFTAGVDFYVKVAPVDDPPLAVADAYDVFEDSTMTIAAKNGVLANDVNPDDPEVLLVAVLVKGASHGEVKLSKDGGFTYTPTADYVGEDFFTYYVYTDDENKTKSDTVKVTLNVQDVSDGPTITIDPAIVDTTIEEDNAKGIIYSKVVVASWFQSEGKITLAASSDDKKTTSEITTANALSIKLAKDAVGDAYVTVSATDEEGGTSKLKVHVKITPVNDKPVVLKTDTINVKEVNDWTVKIAMTDYVKDIDGDTLEYTPNLAAMLARKVDVVVKGDTLVLSAKETATFEKGDLLAFGVKCADATTYVTASIYVRVGSDGAIGTRAIAAAPKATWQNAVKATRGAVALLDMQGRVMWKSALPASEADVRNAAAKVQGRKILMVNKQTWTIK